MGRAWHCFVTYMVSYAALMFASYLLWRASGLYSGVSVDAAGGAISLSLFHGLSALSDFLVVFAVFAYPAYAVVKAAISRLSRRGGMRFGAKRPSTVWQNQD